MFVFVLIWVVGVDMMAGRWEVSVLCLWRPSRNIAALTTPEVLTNKPQLRKLQSRVRIRWIGSYLPALLTGDDWRSAYLHLCGTENQGLFYTGATWEPIYYIGSDFPLRSRNIFFPSIGKFQFWWDLKISWYFSNTKCHGGDRETVPVAGPTTGSDCERQFAFDWLNFQLETFIDVIKNK